MVLTDVATGWTECVPLVVRDGGLVIEALDKARELFPFPLKGVDFDNDSAFMNETVVDWCRQRGLEVTRSRAYRKNDQAWVEQKNGAIVRRLVGYGRFEGLAFAEALSRLYAAARLHGNLFQPSFKLRSKTRIGARVIKRYHSPEPPLARVLAHPAIDSAAKGRLKTLQVMCDPILLLSEIRLAQAEPGKRVDRRGVAPSRGEPIANLDSLIAHLGTAWRDGERRPTHRRADGSSRSRGNHRRSTRSRARSRLTQQPDLSAVAILGRLRARSRGLRRPACPHRPAGGESLAVAHGTPDHPRRTRAAERTPACFNSDDTRIAGNIAI